MSDRPLNDAPRDVQEEQLARMVLSSRVLWHLWHQAPREEVLKELEAFFTEWPLGEERDDVQAGLALMKNGLTADFKALSMDYADLFVGPDVLKAAPWGSVYLNEEQTTFGETTLAVRDFFRQHGMEVETGEREPDDHLGLMFAFIAWLGEQGLEQNEVEPLQPCFCSLRTFLSEHLLTWAPRVCELVEERAETDFYKGLGKVTAGVLAEMAVITGAEARPGKAVSINGRRRQPSRVAADDRWRGSQNGSCPRDTGALSSLGTGQSQLSCPVRTLRPVPGYLSGAYYPAAGQR